MSSGGVLRRDPDEQRIHGRNRPHEPLGMADHDTGEAGYGIVPTHDLVAQDIDALASPNMPTRAQYLQLDRLPDFRVPLSERTHALFRFRSTPDRVLPE